MTDHHHDDDPIAALAGEVRGLRGDLTRYSERLDARMKRRNRTWAGIALGSVATLLLLIVVVWGLTNASVERQADTLERAYQASCQQVRSLELIIVDVLRDRLEQVEAAEPETLAEERRLASSREFLQDAITRLLAHSESCDPEVIVSPTPTP